MSHERIALSSEEIRHNHESKLKITMTNDNPTEVEVHELLTQRVIHSESSTYVIDLPQSTGLTLRLQEAEDVSLTDRSLDVTDEGTLLTSALTGGRILGEELNSDLWRI
jgi:hypothetical protein